MAQKDPPQGIEEGLFVLYIRVFKAWAKKRAKAAAKAGLVSIFIKKVIKVAILMSLLSFGASSRHPNQPKSSSLLSVDNNDQQVISSVMSQEHESLENLLDEDRLFPPSAEFAAQANAQPELYDQAEKDRLAFGMCKRIA